jgi:hypothetical protein
VKEPPSSPQQKALRINLDARRYGTFAEIGAGQEVARWFFQVGGASGTVAKTMSAYDMAVSDAIYGPSDRYVSRRRLQAMLDHEYGLLIERLERTQGESRAFFVFADTVATHSYYSARREEGHGWMGIRFQSEPRSAPSEIVLHVRLREKENVHQQEALGIIGVNLIHGAFYHHDDPDALLSSLLDNLTWERVEVDMVRFSGPAFAGVDNRVAALQLVRLGLTEAAMFTGSGEAAQWAEVLYKKPVLVQRGSFQPVTLATLDVLDRAEEAFRQDLGPEGAPPVVLMEMTLRQLTTGEAIDTRNFLDRSDSLCALGRSVLISNFRRQHRLAAYLSRYTDRPIAHAMGGSKLSEVFDPSFYNPEEGGLLGGLGLLFRNQSRLYVYPTLDFATGRVTTAESYPISPDLRLLYAHLLGVSSIRGIPCSNPAFLRIRSQDLIEQMRSGNPAWEAQVPPALVPVIREKGLFGWRTG